MDEKNILNILPDELWEPITYFLSLSEPNAVTIRLKSRKFPDHI